MKIIGHRGSMLYGYENTLKAFKQAKELGAEWVEIDIEITKDGVPVLMHDETIDRTTTGTGKVVDMTFKQLRRYTVDGEEKIPSLEEVLDFLYEEGMGVDIEVKSEMAFAPVFDVLKKMGDRLPEVIISSFWNNYIREAKKKYPEYQMGYLYNSRPADLESMLKEVDFLMPFYTYVDEEYEKYADRIIPWPVDDPRAIARFVKMGVFAIITDIPDVAADVRAGNIPDMSKAIMRAIHLIIDLSSVKRKEKDGKDTVSFYMHNRLIPFLIRSACGQDVVVKTKPKLPTKLRYGDRMKVSLEIVGPNPAIYLDTTSLGLIKLDVNEILKRAEERKKRRKKV
ncbi:MAG: hypothetical protein GXO59_02960 [Dictyoglomi bacterium]|nr:hypothetical protein [Dictyoglomota bacterium]